MHDPLLAAPTTGLDPFQLFDFSSCHQVIGEVRFSYVLALCHAVWVHASIGQLSTITLWVVLNAHQSVPLVLSLYFPFPSSRTWRFSQNKINLLIYGSPKAGLHKHTVIHAAVLNRNKQVFKSISHCENMRQFVKNNCLTQMTSVIWHCWEKGCHGLAVATCCAHNFRFYISGSGSPG